MRKKLRVFRGISFCVCAAIVVSLWMNDPDLRLVAPFICLFAVTMAAFFWGRISAILGAVGASITFCLLFPPLGSITVANNNQRVAIIAFLLIAIFAVRLAPPNHSRVR